VNRFPIIAIGTHGMDYKTMRPVVMAALENGIRAFDTARQYGNEAVVGRVLKDSLKATGLDRTDIFITTKIWYAYGLDRLEDSLRCLYVDYVDMCLIHYPYPDWYVDAYRRLQTLKGKGLTIHVGVSNFRKRHIEKLRSNIGVYPECIQFERHPLRTATSFVSYCKEHGISMQAQSPLCVMEPRIRNSQVLKDIARVHEKSISQIILRWHQQSGLCPVVRSTNPERVVENAQLDAFALSQEEINAIDGMNLNYKYLLESLYCPGF